MLYSRLLELKVNGPLVGKFSNPNPVAIEFGFHSDQYDELDKEVEEAKSRYPPFLELCKRLIEGEHDITMFEDEVRHLYGTKGYKMYTVDKLIAAMIKQVSDLSFAHSDLSLSFLTSDQKTRHILVLYEKDRFEEKTTAREQIVYRIQVEGMLAPEDHLFRFEWVRPFQTTSMLTDQDDELRRLGIQLLTKEDLTLDQATTREERWAYYVDSYYMHANTEGIATHMLHPPMLRRSINANEVLSDPAVIASDLQVKICLNTYKLFYLCDTEDAFIRSAADRAVKPTRWNYIRAARKADGKKWTFEGRSTREAEEEKAALEAARAQNVVPHPSSIGVPSTVQTIEGAPVGETALPVEQPPTEATLVSSVPGTEDGPAPGEVKMETPPLASEPGEAMDIEEPAVVAVPEPPQDETPATEDVEMADA